MLGSGMAHSQAELEDKLGVDRTRIGQFLRLMRLPVETKVRLRAMPDLNEFQTRSIIRGIQKDAVYAPKAPTVESNA